MDRAFVVAAMIIALTSWVPHGPVPAVAEEPPADASAAPKFSADQIDQMVAPVALYPDALLAQILIASTYPLEIVEADRWARQNASLKGDALDKALEEKDWDPSIKSLTTMPDLLKRLSDNLDWTKDLGDAFLGQKDDVMSAIQTMRRKASEAGNLKTSEQQTVKTETINNKETIVIQPTNPETVYVPTYPPTVYGSTYAPTTPYYGAPAYGYTGAQMATTGLLAFGTGVAVGALVSDGFGWGDNDVHYHGDNYNNGGGGGGNKNNNNNNSNNNVNVNVDKSKNVDRSKTVNKEGGKSWQHNPEHRRNVGYRDPSTQKKFEGRDANVARDKQVRDQARGFDNNNNRSGRGDAGKRGDVGGPGGAGGRGDVGGRGDAGKRGDVGGAGGPGGRGDAGGRGGAGGADRGKTQQAKAGGGRGGAYGDYGNGNASRQASQRGASSRGTQSYAGSGGGGGGGGGARSGGGGGGGGGGRGGGGGGGGGGRGGGGGGRGGGGGGGGRRR